MNLSSTFFSRFWPLSQIEKQQAKIKALQVIIEAKDARLAALEKELGKDDLTAATSRRYFIAQLERAHAQVQRKEEDAELYGLLYIDFDRFKVINDTYDHSVGDEVLVKAVDRMKRFLRDTDVLGRLGGDEFAVLATIDSVEEIEEMSERLSHAMEAKPLQVSVGSIEVGVSVGGVLIDRRSRVEDLLRTADQTMYRKKTEQR